MTLPRGFGGGARCTDCGEPMARNTDRYSDNRYVCDNNTCIKNGGNVSHHKTIPITKKQFKLYILWGVLGLFILSNIMLFTVNISLGITTLVIVLVMGHIFGYMAMSVGFSWSDYDSAVEIYPWFKPLYDLKGRYRFQDD